MNATMPPHPDDLLTTFDAARILDCTPDLVRHYNRIGVLAAMKTIGGRRIFRRDDVERLRDERQARASA